MKLRLKRKQVVCMYTVLIDAQKEALRAATKVLPAPDEKLNPAREREIGQAIRHYNLISEIIDDLWPYTIKEER